jgi:hypothetical protein
MISLDSFDIKSGIEYHSEAINTIFDAIKSRKKTKNKIKHQLSSAVLTFIEENKPNLINGKPSVLLDIHNEYLKQIPDNEKQDVKVIFEYVYENYFQKKHGKEFLNKLNIDTCVYCNRNYTLDFKKLNNSRAQLDHWFPKDKFPILALSFYNLIPSCQSCNHIKGNGNKIVKEILNIKSKDKKNKEEEKEENLKIQEWWEKEALKHLNHPYLKSLDFKFTWFFNDSLKDTKVEFRVKENSKSDNTLKFNNTKEIYNAHSNKELKDLLDLRYKYSENYIDILIDKTFKGIMSKEEIYRMVFGIEINEEKYHERPFSKFKHDIIEELKNIKND